MVWKTAVRIKELTTMCVGSKCFEDILSKKTSGTISGINNDMHSK